MIPIPFSAVERAVARRRREMGFDPEWNESGLRRFGGLLAYARLVLETVGDVRQVMDADLTAIVQDLDADTTVEIREDL